MLMKKKYAVLLLVVLFAFNGCSKSGSMELAESGKTEVNGETFEKLTTEEDTDKAETDENETTDGITEEKETVEATEQQATKQQKTEHLETKTSETKKQEVNTTKTEVKVADEETTKPQEPKSEEPKSEVSQTISYDPNMVVSLATEKTKAMGKISIPEDLDNMLKNGEITKAEYDQCYPYDGTGYYSVFVETDLNQAATTSGRKLVSVEGIAEYIAGMLALETGPYFYIEYTGITTTGGSDFYEFRCYRG